jgi:hypothetical protein
MFYLSPIYIEALSKFRRVSNKASGKFFFFFFLNISFPMKLLVYHVLVVG